jgi:hypothetical protein
MAYGSALLEGVIIQLDKLRGEFNDIPFKRPMY